MLNNSETIYTDQYFAQIILIKKKLLHQIKAK